MNQGKTTHHTIDHFGSVKYAELVDLMEENRIANSPVPIAVISYLFLLIYRCPRRNMPDFWRVFLVLTYTDITQNTYVQS